MNNEIKNENKPDDNILKALNDLLISKIDEKQYVINKKSQRVNRLVSILNWLNIEINSIPYCNINYYLEPYYTYEFYNDKSYQYINYYFSSFNKDDLGLEKSQLKTLFNILKSCNEYEYNRYIPINGGPGVGKSTIASYIISNLLLQDFNNNNELSLQQICENLPNILITGFTKQSVKNLSEISAIQPPKNHNWIKPINNLKYNEEIDFLFYQLNIDFQTIFNFNSETDKIKCNELSDDLKIIWYKETYLSTIEISNELFQHINNSFLDGFRNYFNIPISNNISFQTIKNYIQDKIIFNKNIITTINELIQNQINNKLLNDCNELFNFLISLKPYYKEKNYKAKLDDCKNIINEIINLKFIDYASKNKIVDDKLNKQIKKINSIYSIVANNIKIKFHSKNKIFKKILKICKNILSCYFQNFEKLINDFLLKIEGIFKNPYVMNVFSDFDIKIDEIISKQKKLFKTLQEIDFLENNDDVTFKKEFFEFLYLIDNFTINFNRIQKKLDTSFRSENTFLFRHFQECLFIEKIYNNAINKSQNYIYFKIDILKIIKPIFSSNIQKISTFLLKTLKVYKKNFDFTIVDEASQLNAKYALFLETITNKCLFALGDDKQLEPIKNENEDTKKWDEIISFLNLNNFKNLSDINKHYSSFLDYVNKKTSLISNLSNDNNIKLYKGLYLLEHFRCPEQIFNLFNDGFYSGNLFFKNPNVSNCLVSNCINENVLCNDTSFIYITYNSKDEYWKWIDSDINKTNEKTLKYHINLKEIEIGFKFIIKNFDIFSKHILKSNASNFYLKDLNINQINKISKNICFISLYKNQDLVVKYFIKQLIEKFLPTQKNDFFNSNIFELLNDEVKQNFKNLVNTNEFKKLLESIECEIKNKFNDLDSINNFLKILSLIKVGTIDALQGIGCEFVIFSLIAKKCNQFENEPKRINVLLSRVKKHFIQILNNEYWENYQNKINNFAESTKDTITIRQNIEINWKSFGYSKILINLHDSQDINKLLDLNSWKDLKETIKNNKFESVEKKINIIGRRGENVFNGILSDSDFKLLVKDKIYQDTNIDIDQNFELKWMNEKTESLEPYDFVLSNNDNKIYIDVKTTFKDKIESSNIFMSENELKFSQEIKNIKNQKYLIAKVSDVSNYNLCFKNKSSLFFILKNLEFYLVEKENEQLNKKYICVQLKNNNKTKQQEIIIRK